MKQTSGVIEKINLGKIFNGKWGPSQIVGIKVGDVWFSVFAKPGSLAVKEGDFVEFTYTSKPYQAQDGTEKFNHNIDPKTPLVPKQKTYAQPTSAQSSAPNSKEDIQSMIVMQNALGHATAIVMKQYEVNYQAFKDHTTETLAALIKTCASDLAKFVMTKEQVKPQQEIDNPYSNDYDNEPVPF
jgi:hypothetical protein